MNLIEPIFDIETIQDYPGFDWSTSLSEMAHFLSSAPLTDNLRIEQSRAKIDDGVTVTDYETLVVSRFYVDNDLHLGLADGRTLNAGKMLRDLRIYLESIGALS